MDTCPVSQKLLGTYIKCKKDSGTAGNLSALIART